MLEGAQTLDRRLAALGAAGGKKVLMGALRAAMKIALDEAKVRLPIGSVEHKTYKGRLVSPGFAQRSLRIIVVANAKEGVYAKLGVRWEAFYAVQFIELGTAKMPARPWLVPSFLSTKEAQLARLSAELEARIKKAAQS